MVHPSDKHQAKVWNLASSLCDTTNKPFSWPVEYQRILLGYETGRSNAIDEANLRAFLTDRNIGPRDITRILRARIVLIALRARQVREARTQLLRMMRRHRRGIRWSTTTTRPYRGYSIAQTNYGSWGKFY